MFDMRRLLSLTDALGSEVLVCASTMTNNDRCVRIGSSSFCSDGSRDTPSALECVHCDRADHAEQEVAYTTSPESTEPPLCNWRTRISVYGH